MKFMKLGSRPDFFQGDGKDIRFVATDLAADIIIHVGNLKFHLHKFPLLSRSHRLQKLLATTDDDENTDEICISDIPGGAAAFEMCAKFCYGMTVTLNAHNVTAARCAAEYLEMHETVDRGNLIYKIDVFLRSSILRSWKDSIIVLQTARSFLPWSEELKLIDHCIESIVSKASVDASRVEWSYSYNRKKLPSENGLDPLLINGARRDSSVPNDWWVEDLCDLDIDFFKKIIAGVKSKGKVGSEVIGEALKSYTCRKLSCLSKGYSRNGGDAAKNQSLLETIVSLLPSEKGCVSCGFLLKLLRAGCILHYSETFKKDLAKRIGRQLEDAAVPDLLIPTTSGENTMYDIDMVLNIVEEFVMQDNGASQTSLKAAEEHQELGSPKLSVAKLVDGYLVEAAKDPNLPLSKFIDLAELISNDSRPVHDDLYRAIDTYLKEHPGLSKNERKKLCTLMDCRKFSVDASAHAVQNERLSLRLVVQVLYFEQMRVLTADTTTSRAESGASYGSSRSVITTNTEDECDGVLAIEDFKAAKPTGGGNNSSSKITCQDKSSSNDGRVKGTAKPNKMLGKLLSSKGSAGESSSSSDSSGSPNSANCEEQKLSTPSSNLRYSV